MKFGKSAPYHLYNSCLRKLSYPSEAEAEVVLQQMEDAPREPDWKAGQRLHVYECDYAAHYHIGHVSKDAYLFA